MEAIWNGSIFIPRYASPKNPAGIIPPSPPGEARMRRESALRRALRSFTGRLPESWRAMAGLVNGGMVNSGHAMVNAGVIRCAAPSGPPVPSPAIYLRADTGLFTDTAGTTPVVNDGDAVACWTDQSTNAYKFIQATAGNKPLYKTAVSGQAKTVLFDGSDDFLGSAGATIGANATIFALLRLNSSSGFGGYIISPEPTTSKEGYAINASNKQAVEDFGVVESGAGSSTLSNVTWTQLNVVYTKSPAKTIFRMAKAADATLDPTPFTVQDFLVNAVGAAINTWKGWIVLILVYASALNPTQVTDTETWITATFGV